MKNSNFDVSDIDRIKKFLEILIQLIWNVKSYETYKSLKKLLLQIWCNWYEISINKLEEKLNFDIKSIVM